VAEGAVTEVAFRGLRWSMLATVVAVSLLAWLWLERSGSDAGAALLHPHRSASGLEAFLQAVPMWWAMMLAMMLPPSLPWFIVLDRLDRGELSLTAFALGFLTVWLAYGAGGAALQVLFQRLAFVDRDLALLRPWSGVVLVGAGLYQWTPLKNACLSRCRNPLSYFLTHWREGRGGGFRTGIGHGIDCLGCCWALMATGFALGVMNVLWMAALTVLLAIEILAPRAALVGRATGAGLVAWGVAVLSTHA
jgi:predicted metal-binding membrane protein